MSQSLFDTDAVDKNAWHLQGNWGLSLIHI